MVLILYKHKNHSYIMTSMVGFYGFNYYCEKYDEPNKNRNMHVCVDSIKIVVVIVTVLNI